MLRCKKTNEEMKMTANVVGQSGKNVVVATLSDVNGEASDIPIATTSSTGVVKGGGNVSVASDGTMSVVVAAGTKAGVVSIGTGIAVASGEISVAAATMTVKGGVLLGAPVADVETIAVTDIQSAQDAIAAMGTTLSELQQVLRASGVIASS